jgi:hypothetical protein
MRRRVVRVTAHSMKPFCNYQTGTAASAARRSLICDMLTQASELAKPFQRKPRLN